MYQYFLSRVFFYQAKSIQRFKMHVLGPTQCCFAALEILVIIIMIIIIIIIIIY